MVKLKENDPHKYGWTIDEYEQKLLRVVRAGEKYRILYGKVGETNALIDLWEALEALPEHLRGE